MKRTMGIAFAAFVAMFLVITSAGLLLFYRDSMMKRMSVVVSRTKTDSNEQNALQRAGSSLGEMVKRLDKVIPKTQAEVSVAQQRLIRAGYRGDSCLKLFYGSKLALPVALCAASLMSGLAAASPFIICVSALGVGYLAPDFWIGRRIAVRQTRLRRGLADMLDLLVICIEAGLSMDQATARTAQELRQSHPAISDEVGVVVLEQQAGCSRSDAWRHLSERTDVDSYKTLVSMIVQAETFGSSMSRMLRTHSEALRTQRVQAVEEMAAKTTIKLIFPLVLFIFPCLFLVTLGPVFILMSKSFKMFTTH
jgi:tight adherence protein C